jgi:hypothetical protein
MAIDILSITPPAERTETVAFGGGEVEIRGLRMSQVARIAQRFDGFRKAFFKKDAEEEYRGAAMLEAWPAIIAAGLGKDKSADRALVEAHIEKFPQEEQMALGEAILRLTNPDGAKAAPDDAPLPDSAAIIAEAVGAASTTSSSQSSS